MGAGIMFCLVLAIAIASADASARYNVYSATIEEDGTISYSNVPILGLSAVGYTCGNAACTSVGSQVSALSATTTTNQITLNFPAQLVSPNGYALRFYKDGYIFWEQTGVKIWGNFPGQVFDSPNPVYLSRKATGYALITGLEIENEVHPGLPVEVDLQVGIDARTYSAIEDSRHSDIPAAENVAIRVMLEIEDNQGDIVYTQAQDLNIPYSGSVPISFTYAGFSDTGIYTIIVSTQVTDGKIINPIEQETSAQIEVIEQGRTDYAYSLLGGLSLSPLMPEADEQVIFSFNHESYYINSAGESSDILTEAEIEIYRNGERIEEFYLHDLSAGTQTFQRTFGNEGSYRILIHAEPENAISYGDVVDAEQELSFVVGEPGEDDDDEDDDDDDDEDEDDENSEIDEEYELMLLQNSGTSGEVAIDLTPETPEKISLLKKFVWGLAIGILIILVLIAVLVAVKRRI